MLYVTFVDWWGSPFCFIAIHMKLPYVYHPGSILTIFGYLFRKERGESDIVKSTLTTYREINRYTARDKIADDRRKTRQKKIKCRRYTEETHYIK